MLNFRSQTDFRRFSLAVLLVFISSVTSQIDVFAGIKDQAAQEYRESGYKEQQKGNLNEALSYYIKAVSLGLENATVFNDMGVILESLGRSGKAEQQYLEALKINARYLPAYSNLAYLYKGRGQKEKAFQFFRKRFELSRPGDPWAQKAKEEIVKIYPEYRDFLNSLEAEQLAQEVILKNQKDFYEQVKRSQEFYHRGVLLREQGDYKKAIQSFDHSLKLSPGNPQVVEARNQAILADTRQIIDQQSQKAIQLLNSGNPITAKREIQKILATIPDDPIIVSR